MTTQSQKMSSRGMIQCSLEQRYHSSVRPLYVFDAERQLAGETVGTYAYNQATVFKSFFET